MSDFEPTLAEIVDAQRNRIDELEEQIAERRAVTDEMIERASNTAIQLKWMLARDDTYAPERFAKAVLSAALRPAIDNEKK